MPDRGTVRILVIEDIVEGETRLPGRLVFPERNNPFMKAGRTFSSLSFRPWAVCTLPSSIFGPFVHLPAETPKVADPRPSFCLASTRWALVRFFGFFCAATEQVSRMRPGDEIDLLPHRAGLPEASQQ